MRSEVRVSVVQFEPTWLDVEANAESMAKIADAEAAAGTDLVVFPELVNTGYIRPCPPSEDPAFASRFFAAAESVPGLTTERLGEVARRTGIHIVVGMAVRHGSITDGLLNAAVLIGPDGKVLGQQNKIHLPLMEKLYFTPGARLRTFDTDLGRIGMTICYDGRFPETTRVLAVQGAEIVCSLWARFQLEGFVDGASNHHMAYIRAQENANFYILACRSGKEDSVSYIGHSAVGSPKGSLLASSSSAEPGVVHATLHAADLSDARRWVNIFADRRPDVYRILCAPTDGSAATEP